MHGCQAKKFFYEAAETVARSNHLQGLGLTKSPGYSWDDILVQKNKFTAGIPEATVNGLQGVDIDFIPGSAKFVGPQTLEVNGGQIEAQWIILATGAIPMPLPLEGHEHLISSTEFLDLPTLPEIILFVGGGFISFEFAHFAARLGPENRQVVILEAGSKPLGPFDGDMVALLGEASRDEGIEIHSGVQITSITQEGQGYAVAVKDKGVFQADLVVHGAGRVGDVAGLNLEAGGIEFDRRGIIVDSSMRSSNPHVFAVGDCANTIQLARVADREAQVAVQNIVADKDGGETSSMDYAPVPSLLFTYPQYGMVGKTEAALKHEGTKYYKSFGKNLGWPTYRRVGMKHAAYKILVGEDSRILGAHFLSDNASGLVNLFRLAMIHGIKVEDLHEQSLVSPYPSRESDVVYMLAPFVE